MLRVYNKEMEEMDGTRELRILCETGGEKKKKETRKF